MAWNVAANRLFSLSQVPDGNRNILLSVLTYPLAKQLFGSHWATQAKRMVAQFRATHELLAGDPAFVELIEKLRHGCSEFSRCWEIHEVRSAFSGKKQLTLIVSSVAFVLLSKSQLDHLVELSAAGQRI